MNWVKQKGNIFILLKIFFEPAGCTDVSNRYCIDHMQKWSKEFLYKLHKNQCNALKMGKPLKIKHVQAYGDG